jgi:site-specific DNA-methyltransferase (adenine-specific)
MGDGEEKKKRREKNGMTGVINGVDWDTKIDLEKFWTQVKRLAKDDHTPVLMFCNTKFGIDLINSNPSWFRYDLVWAKTNAVGFLQANSRPMASHEMIYVFSKKGSYYKRINYTGDFPKGGGGRSSANCFPIGDLPNLGVTQEGIRCPTSVITIANKKTKGGHPTAKPVELYEWLIARYCPEGGTVLDPTAGSFNSVFTAAKLGRNAIGIEQNTKYFWNAVSLVV